MAGKGRCHDEVKVTPEAPVAVVLGTSARLADGRANLFFLPRMEAAASLFKAGKVKALIVSGDNGSQGYDEPTEMKRVLTQMGVPESKVVCDYAGFRTLDSVVRAREVFGQQSVIFVSQRFHNVRAIYLAKAFGIEAWGLNAKDVPVALSVKTFLREKLACVKAVLDVNVLGTRPKFLGEKVAVPLE
jgi:SanA protein